MADDFASGTRSAACGGTTTVMPFAAQLKGQSLRKAVADYHQRADGRAYLDYAFHLIVTDPTPQVLGQELPALIRDGYTSFKIYMTYDALKLSDREILEVLALARSEQALVMIHAENADCIGWLTERLERCGNIAPKFHASARPQIAEREATHRAIALAELVDTPILIVHVSGPEAIEQIRWGRSRGLRIYAETCPQYLFLTADDLAAPGFHGAKCVCSPPPRDRASHAAIWAGLRDGLFQVFSSDHAPFRYDDPKGKKVAKATSEFCLYSQRYPRPRDSSTALVFVGRRRRAHRSLPVCRAHGDQPSENVRSLPSKGLDRDRRRRGFGHLGRQSQRSDQQRPSASQRRLHALRRHASTRLARDDGLTRRDRLVGRRIQRIRRPRAVPTLRSPSIGSRTRPARSLTMHLTPDPFRELPSRSQRAPRSLTATGRRVA